MWLFKSYARYMTGVLSEAGEMRLPLLFLSLYFAFGPNEVLEELVAGPRTQ